MDSLQILTALSIILLLGMLSSIFSKKMRVPDMIALIIVGIVLSEIKYEGTPILSLPDMFLIGISLLALIMIVFDSCAKLKLRQIDFGSVKALRLVLVFLFFNLTLLTIATQIIFGISNIYLIIIFAIVMTGTSPDVVMPMLGTAKNKITEIIELESIINTPLIVLLPFITIDIMQNLDVTIMSKFIEQLSPFLQQIITGIGAGVLVGIIIFKVMRHVYSKTFSPLAVIIAILLTYVLAENLGGNGILAITTLGLFFGNLHIKQKFNLLQFESIFSKLLDILVFVLIGFMIKIPITFTFIWKSLLLYVIFLFIRFIAVNVSFSPKNFKFKERLFLSLVAPKGIATAVVAFTLASLNIAGLTEVLHLILTFLLYSIILSTIMMKLSKYFLGVEVE